jgi:hypothetical protein
MRNGVILLVEDNADDVELALYWLRLNTASPGAHR